MTAFSKNLSALIEKRGISQSAIAAVAGVTPGAVSIWLSGRSEPRAKSLSKICDYYGVTVDDLISDQNGLYAKRYNLTDKPAGAMPPVEEPRKAYAPLLGKVHAGEFEEPVVLDERVPIPYEVWEHHKRGYFLEVRGTCMDMVYGEKDYVYIDPDITPADGDIAVVQMEGGDVMMRRLKTGTRKLFLVPESHDPEWDDIVIEGEVEIDMLGTVVWYQPREELTRR